MGGALAVGSLTGMKVTGLEAELDLAKPLMRYELGLVEKSRSSKSSWTELH